MFRIDSSNIWRESVVLDSQCFCGFLDYGHFGETDRCGQQSGIKLVQNGVEIKLINNGLRAASRPAGILNT